MNPQWYDFLGNLHALARWLEHDGQFTDQLDVIRFYEEPWHWTTEWEAYQAGVRFLEGSQA